MKLEVPENEVRSATHDVSAEGLFHFLEAVHQEPNLVRIEYVKIPHGFKVTVHYAVMDLARQLAVTSARIERLVGEANSHSPVS